MAKKSTVTAKMVEHWIGLYNQGKSCRAIAKDVGYGKTTVEKHLKEAGVLRKKRSPTKKEKEEWAVAFQAGASPYELAKQYGFNDETIRTHLKAQGVKMRPAGGKTIHSHDLDEQMQNLYLLEQLSPREIASLLKVSETTVSVRLREMGTPMRSAGESNRRVTDALVAKWVKDYGSLSSVQIAERDGFSSTTVLDYLHRVGIDTGPIIGKEEIGQIKKRYDSGENIGQIASSFGVTSTYIRLKLKESGVEIRQPDRGYSFDEDVIDEWQTRYESGESLASIAFDAGLKSGDTVKKRLEERGVTIREKVSSTASSWPEWAIYFYMKAAFPEFAVDNNPAIDTPKGARFPDVAVRSSDGSFKLAIEYDGRFWHDRENKREQDEEKSRLLQNVGFKVYRIIENDHGMNCVDGNTIYCTSESKGTESGLGYAICELLGLLHCEGIDVDFRKDSAEISSLYYAAKNRTAHGKEWAGLYADGHSTIEIAQAYGVTSTTVSSSLKRQGVEIRHKPIDETERQIWVEMYKAGSKVPAIAKERQLNKSIIYRYLKSIGVEFDKHPKKESTDTDLEWKRLYEDEGYSLSRIAKQYGRSTTTVSNHLKKLGVAIRR